MNPAAVSSGSAAAVVGEAAERSLRVRARESRQRQAQGDVPTPTKRLLVVPARWVGRVRQRRGSLEQPRRLRVRGQTPSRLPVQPLPQPGQVPPDEDQHLAVGVGDQQRLGEQGLERGPALGLFPAGVMRRCS